MAALTGYGIVLPFAARVRSSGIRSTWREDARSRTWLWPAFLASVALYLWYPWTLTGEVVELMAGLGFLLAAPALRSIDASRPRRGLSTLRPLLLVTTVFAAATMCAAASLSRGGDRALSGTALAELHELAAVLVAIARRDGSAPTRCNLHKRVYTFVETYDVRELRPSPAGGDTGVPADRTGYFLDPWNSPYWIRDRCSRKGGRRHVFVYSFGPNRRRESSAWEIAGDDLGVYLMR